MKHLFIIICLLLYQVASAQNANTKKGGGSPATINVDKYFKIDEDKDTFLVYRMSKNNGSKCIYTDFWGISFYNGKPGSMSFGPNEFSFKEIMCGFKEALKDLTQEYSLDNNYYQMWIDPFDFGYEAIDISMEYERLHPRNKKFDGTLLRKLYEKSRLINAIKDTLLLYDLEMYQFSYEKVQKLSRYLYYKAYPKKSNKRKIPQFINCPWEILLEIRPLKK